MKVKKVLSIILVFIWMSVVFSFSNQQGEGSGNTSRKVSEIVVNIIDIKGQYTDSEKQELIIQIEPWIRKLAHYTIYIIGGVAIINCVYQFTSKEKMQIMISTTIGVLYAASDEMHQLMVNGRSGNVRDVIIDSLGILTGIIFFLFVNQLWKIISKKKRIEGGE